jgi:hypothetical protein
VHTPAASVAPRATSRRVDAIGHAAVPTAPADAALVGFSRFCQQLLQHLQLQIAFGYHLVQPRLLTLQLS